MYLTFRVQGARRRGGTAARTGVLVFIRSLAPGRHGQTLPTAEESQGPGFAHGFPCAISAPGLWVSSTPRAPGARDTQLSGSAGAAGRAGCLRHPVLPVHPAMLCGRRHPHPSIPRQRGARWGPRWPHVPRHSPSGLGELPQVLGNKPPSAAKLNTRCFLQAENKPGQSYGRYFQAGRAEVLPAHQALAGREKGRRWRE